MPVIVIATARPLAERRDQGMHGGGGDEPGCVVAHAAVLDGIETVDRGRFSDSRGGVGVVARGSAGGVEAGRFAGRRVDR